MRWATHEQNELGQRRAPQQASTQAGDLRGSNTIHVRVELMADCWLASGRGGPSR
jgi:predicted metalloprotease